MRQVLTNLLGNAVKFTERGEVALEVSLKPTSTDAARILFKIRDTGIESTSRQYRVCSRYSVKPTNRCHGVSAGTGLGLAICKQLVELMGGQLTVESTLGKGTTFRCEIPFQPAQAASLPAVHALTDSLAGRRAGRRRQRDEPSYS